MKEQVPSAKIIGKVSHRFAEITSTNNHAKQLIANGEPVHGTVILADYQTGGRGQMGKQWQATPGKNLLCSVILKPESSIAQQFYLNKAVALAVSDTVMSFIKFEAQIKWPNDILVEETKICGILIENFIQNGLLQYAVVGAGLNVNQMFFPEEIKATSLQLITGINYNVLEVAQSLYNYLEKWMTLFLNQQFEEIDSAYHKRLYNYENPQVFRKNGQQFIGVIKGVNAMGLLEVEVNGQLQVFRNQEVVFVI